jgi:hypothetical protein
VSAPSERAGQLRKLPRTQALLRTHTHLGPGSGRLTLKRVSCHAQGGVPTRHSVGTPPWGGPPLPARARAAPRPRSPAQLTSFCPAPSKHLGKPANCSPGREAQRGRAPGPACAQGSPVRCGCARCRQARPAAVVRAHTHTSTRAQRCLRSAHTQLAQLPYPPAPPPPRLPFQHSFGQLKIVNCPTPQTSALFSGPHGLSGSLGTS